MPRTLSCLITDNRYSVPTLSFYLDTDIERARALAIADLKANRHHEAVEIRAGDEMVFSIRRDDPALRESKGENVAI